MVLVLLTCRPRGTCVLLLYRWFWFCSLADHVVRAYFSCIDGSGFAHVPTTWRMRTSHVLRVVVDNVCFALCGACAQLICWWFSPRGACAITHMLTGVGLLHSAMDKIATLSSDKEQLEHLVLRLQVRIVIITSIKKIISLTNLSCSSKKKSSSL